MGTLQALAAVWLSTGLVNFTAGQFIMVCVGFALIYLAVKKGFEPLVLLPLGFGTIFANIPIAGFNAITNLSIDPNTHTVLHQLGGFIGHMYGLGIETGLFPILIFIGIGALIDFAPLIANPVTALIGAGAQFGMLFTLLGALILTKYVGFGYTLSDAAAIGFVGAADGATSVFVASRLAPNLLGTIALAAYSYMVILPNLLPHLIKLLTTADERKISMPQLRSVRRREKILFPLILLALCILLFPNATPLVGALAFGNLLRESGVTERLSKSAQNELMNLTTIMLGLAVGSRLTADLFLNSSTLGILLLGPMAFMMGGAGGIMATKLLNKFTKDKINPMLGVTCVAAVPMTAGMMRRITPKSDDDEGLLQHAMGTNAAGIIGSIMAAGILLTLIPLFG